MAETVEGRRIGIVAFCFGEPATANPNPKIAQWVISWAQAFGSPIYTEKEVAHHLKGLGLDVEVLDPTRPGSTFRVAREAIQWALRRDLKGLVVVAAGPHMARCKRDMRRVISDFGWNEFLIYGEVRGDVWDPQATTAHSRSPFHGWPREIILRLLPWALYKRIAS